ncbi:MAG: InlB B-repeat-containing protein [Roseburia sp.]|nr:InlB B-repeat-containing protein [Roseburia sp.]
MYRRLKNLLGVSLIIFAILLSQIPMPSVQADNADSTDKVTVAFQYGFTNLNPSVETVTVAKGATLGIDKIEITIDGGQRIELKEGQKYTIDAVVYQFDGWCSASTTGPKWDMASSTADTDTKLYAVWERVDGEQFSYDDIAATQDDSSALTSADAKKTIKITFNFGYPSAYFTSPKLPGSAKDVNGVAVLEVDQEVDTETGDVVSRGHILGFEPGSKHTLTVNSTAKDATLLSWQTENGMDWDFNKMTTTDMTLYATWDLGSSECTITYIAANAKDYSKQTKKVKIGSTLPKPDNTPIRPGYTITKWYLDEGATQKIEVDWNQKVASDMTLYAGWQANDITITFDLNGGIYTDTSEGVIYAPANKGDKLSDIAANIDEKQIQYTGYETEDNTWYEDQECFTAANMDATVSASRTLYKKWTKTDDKGFVLSADGKYLYKYEGNKNSTGKLEIKIPDTVTKIGPKAFSDMSSIRSVTLPSNISSIAGDAFCGMESVTDTVYILAADTTETSISYAEANKLANKYSKLEYTSYLKPESVIMNVDSSSFDSNTAAGINNVRSYVDVAASGIEADNYYVKVSPNTETNGLKSYFTNIDKQRIYYLDISMTKGISGTPDYDNTMNYTITFPLPDQWQSWDVTKNNMKVYSNNNNKTQSELEELTIVKIKEDNGVKCVMFKTWHFSPFVLTFNGTVPDNNNNNNNGGNSGGGSSNGGSSSGGGGSSSDSGSSGGGSSSGGSSGGGSSNGGSSGSGTSSAGNGAAGTGTPDITQISTQPAGDGSGQQTGTTGGGSGSGAGSGAGHVKDSTPKTGDPLEYRTLLVCGLFSMGVLMLLIGNKKKSSPFSQYHQA